MKAVLKVVRFNAEDIIATSSFAPRTKLFDYINTNGMSETYAGYLCSEGVEGNMPFDKDYADRLTWRWARADSGNFTNYGSYPDDQPFSSDLYIWYDADNWWTEGKTIEEYGYSWDSTDWRTQ